MPSGAIHDWAARSLSEARLSQLPSVSPPDLLLTRNLETSKGAHSIIRLIGSWLDTEQSDPAFGNCGIDTASLVIA